MARARAGPRRPAKVERLPNAAHSRVRRPIARGDVVLVPFPFSDLSATKRRPAVVLWVDATGVELVLAFISSQQIRRTTVGDLALLPTHPEFSLTGLVVASKIRTTKVVTLSGSLVKRWLGRLGPMLTADLDRVLVAGLGINSVPYREDGRREERGRLVALHTTGGTAALLADLGLGAR